MLWRGRRESSNVEDRRGTGLRTIGTLSGGGLVVALIYTLLTGDPRLLLNQLQEQPSVSASREDEEGVHFVKVVLADTEDVWTTLFAAGSQAYTPPKLVLFSAQVQSACGIAGSSVGPFYCPLDQSVYLDLGFFHEMTSRLGAHGDFAQAYVIAHEVGHHVQNLLGISERMQALRPRLSKTAWNRVSVQIELQADCYAGIWARETNRIHSSLEPGDVEEALGAASAVGDDKLQKASRGYVVPDSFTHGSSAQRMNAFTKGLQSGDPQSCTVALPQVS